MISEEKTDESVLWVKKHVGPYTRRDTGHSPFSLLWEVDLNCLQWSSRIQQWKGLWDCLSKIQEAFHCLTQSTPVWGSVKGTSGEKTHTVVLESHCLSQGKELALR